MDSTRSRVRREVTCSRWRWAGPREPRAPLRVRVAPPRPVETFSAPWRRGLPVGWARSAGSAEFAEPAEPDEDDGAEPAEAGEAPVEDEGP